MNARMMRVGFAALSMSVAFLLSTTSTHAQRWVGADGNPVINPNSGEILDPEFYYDRATGHVSVRNVGANGVVDSPDNVTLLGDDYGLISVMLSISDPTLDPVRILSPFEDGIAWTDPVSFNGNIILTGNGVSAAFLPISEESLGVPIFGLPTGLTGDDFRNENGVVSIVTGVNFSQGAGATLFSTGDACATGAFSGGFCVPEPVSAVLLGPALLLIPFGRRYRL